MRKTKIICTIGPSCDSEEILKEMCFAGMNVARLNFSHGTHESHLDSINRIKKVREELGVPLAITLDTKGPEYRIGSFENDEIFLNSGDTFVFTTDDVAGNQGRVSVNFKDLPTHLQAGDTILVNDGLSEFKVIEVSGADIVTEVITGGSLRNKKSMSFPGKYIKRDYLSEKDRDDIIFGIENDVDFIACSFVSVRQDLADVNALLKEHGGSHICLVAKIENQSGFDNIDEICRECDGIMVARGDLGVEVAYEKLPAMQKDLISKCRMLGKRVITATEMLESMINKPRPTRAEISDVANAVYDGTSAVMLSGETAAGKYPVQAVRAMAKIAEATENDVDYRGRFYRNDFYIKNETDAISHSTCAMAMDLDAKAIVACTISGATARMVSRFRAPIDIIGMTTDEKAWRQLSLSWGVIPVMAEMLPSADVLFYAAKKIASDIMKLEPDDVIVITGGVINGHPGSTNLIKVEHI